MKGYELTKTLTFEAAHRLPNHKGMCRRLHGHSYRLTVHVRTAALVRSGPEDGMIIDTQALSRLIKKHVLKKVDHRYLNRVPGLETPTTENLAAWIHEQLAPHVSALVGIEVEEGFTSSASYPVTVR